MGWRLVCLGWRRLVRAVPLYTGSPALSWQNMCSCQAVCVGHCLHALTPHPNPAASEHLAIAHPPCPPGPRTGSGRCKGWRSTARGGLMPSASSSCWVTPRRATPRVSARLPARSVTHEFPFASSGGWLLTRHPFASCCLYRERCASSRSCPAWITARTYIRCSLLLPANDLKSIPRAALFPQVLQPPSLSRLHHTHLPPPLWSPQASRWGREVN